MNRLERNPQQELALAQIAVQQAAGIDEMLRAPAREADLWREVDHQHLHAQAGAHHEAPGRGGIQLRRVGRGRGRGAVGRHGTGDRLRQAAQLIPGDARVHIRMHDLHFGEPVLRQQREFPSVAGSTTAGDDAGQRTASVVIEMPIEYVELDTQAER